MEQHWFYRRDGGEVGPVSEGELSALAADGKLRAADFVREGVGGGWVPAGACSAAARIFPAVIPTTVAPPPLPAHRAQSGSSPFPVPETARSMATAVGGPVWPWLAGGVVVIFAAGIVWLSTQIGSSTTTSSQALPHPAGNPLLEGSQRTGATNAAASRPHIQVSGRDATDELQAMATELSDDQLRSLGIMFLTTGQDFFASRVRISNVGTSPVFVTPEKIRLHLGAETVGVQTSKDARFLQADLLEPGFYIEGLVLYRATSTAGAAMRLGEGGISYDDPTIQVSY